jgi:hypothetical protein
VRRHRKFAADAGAGLVSLLAGLLAAAEALACSGHGHVKLECSVVVQPVM